MLLSIWLLLLLLWWRKSISFDKARTAAEKLRSRVVLGESSIEEKEQLRLIPTLAEFDHDTYLQHMQKTRRNMGSDLSFWKVHILPRFGKCHLDEITRQGVIDEHLKMRQPGYATGTSNKRIVQIRYADTVAKKFGVPGSEVNPAAGLKQFQVEGRERLLSREETQRPISAALRRHIAIVILLATKTPAYATRLSRNICDRPSRCLLGAIIHSRQRSVDCS